MSIFELSVVLTPIVGAATGVRCGMAHDPITAITAGIGGLLAGVAILAVLVFSPLLLFRLLVGREVSINPKPLEWSLGTLTVLGAAAAPIVAWWVASSGFAFFQGVS